jgi:hypothetical protein
MRREKHSLFICVFVEFCCKKNANKKETKNKKMLGVCAIVEPRKHKALKFVVENVRCSVPDWSIMVFHGTENEDFAKSELKNVENISFVKLRHKNLTIMMYNQLLTSKLFYENFKNYEYVLIFQTDTLLFPHSGFKIDDFLGYDYVGAPWSWRQKKKDDEECDDDKERGGNGGLSLRSVSTMLKICAEKKYSGQCNEDVFFSEHKLCNCPPTSIASNFSVESMFTKIPFGCHKPWDHMKIEDFVMLSTFAPCLNTMVFLNKC